MKVSNPAQIQVERSLFYRGSWELSLVQFNPFSTNLIAAAGGHRFIPYSLLAKKEVLLWDTSRPKDALKAQFEAHTRPISDMAWSLFDPNLLCTCSADEFIYFWDPRFTQTW